MQSLQLLSEAKKGINGVLFSMMMMQTKSVPKKERSEFIYYHLEQYVENGSPKQST